MPVTNKPRRFNEWQASAVDKDSRNRAKYDKLIRDAWGETPLIAAMRCLVKSHHGDFIDLDVPEGA